MTDSSNAAAVAAVQEQDQFRKQTLDLPPQKRNSNLLLQLRGDNFLNNNLNEEEQLNGGGSPDQLQSATAPGRGGNNSRRALTVVNQNKHGDQQPLSLSLVYKDDIELQAGMSFNSPSVKKKKSENQKKNQNGDQKGTSHSKAQAKQSTATNLLDRCLKWISCRKKSQDHAIDDGRSDHQGGHQNQQELRTVIVQPNQHPENANFVSNSIVTTKYTIWSFLPLSIMIQFMRLSNCYFLATGILTAIPGFSPISPASTFAPLCFVIFMSVLREAYEDFNRRRNDKLTNNMPCLILKHPEKFLDCSLSAHGGSPGRESIRSAHTKQDAEILKKNFSQVFWKDVKCGDIIYLQDGEHLPADIVFLMSSEENGECFVQTSSLDGERALKNKQCLVPLRTAIENHGLNNFECTLHCEPPTKNLYEFSGYLESEQLPEKGTVALDGGSKRTITIDNKQLGLRGSNLANTNWVIGVVVYTGKDSKLMLNYGHSRYKQSRVEKVVNMICIYLVITQAVLCLIMAVSSGFYVSQNTELSSDGLRRKAEYIFFTEITTFGRSVNGTATDTSSIGYNPTKEAVMTYGQYFILLNTLIPLSLVVSIEFIKLAQTPFINSDIEMFDEASMKTCEAMNMTLHEEMAQIKYIFADKTGTLTANIMQFKACTIGSVCYDQDYNDDDYEYIEDAQSEEEEEEKESLVSRGEKGSQKNKKQRLTVIREEGIVSEGDVKLELNEEEKLADRLDHAAAYEQLKKDIGAHFFNEQGKEAKTLRRRTSITKILWNFKEAEQIIRNLIQRKRYFINEETNLGASQKQGQPLILQKQNEYLHQFWLNVVLCHDVITSFNYQTDQLAYQGTSPDEITLLDAAKEVGYRFLDRTSDSMKIEIFGKEKSYRLLQKFEFTSDRKKMSVVVQDEKTGLIVLYSKGADLAIFDRLSINIEQHFLEATKEDLIKFSTKGFRTLCFALRVLDEAYFKDWVNRYEAAKLEAIKLGVNKGKGGNSIDPNQVIIALQNELEDGLFLLGATALEDKLQDGVPEAIEDFNNAGMKVWMLTGDKLETAENIGFSSKMFNEKMFIFKLQTQDKATTRKRLEQIEQKIIELEKQHAVPVIGAQFILNPNAAADYEAKNIIRALEEFKHESRNSEYTINESWTRKPILKRKMRKRLEEIVPDKNAIADRLIRENQVFQRSVQDQKQYIPRSFDMNANQFIIKQTNIYRSAESQKIKNISNSVNIAGMNLGINNQDANSIIDNEDKYGILVEGHTLAHIIDSKSMTERFLKILGQCQAVVVCRASPSQKAQVVQLIKDNDPNAVTLAIGDGANDVNMIKRAHIGIGIFGKEGYQAAGNSDYAIGQFRFLRRLLFVHGRLNGIRLSIFMLLFFNKNIVSTVTQFWFGWNNGFSGQSYFDEMYMSSFNIFATNFAVCALAVWDIDIDVDSPKKKKIFDLFLPQIYKHSQENELFTTKKFFAWSAVSLLQSLFMYGVPQLTFADYIFSGGKQQDFWAQGLCSYFSIVFQHYITTCFFTRNYTLWILLWYVLSLGLFAPFQIVTFDNVWLGQAIYQRLFEIVFMDWQFWLSLLASLSVCLVPFFFYYLANELLFPSIKDLILQEAIDIPSILEEADPTKAKEAMDIMKAKQQQVLQQWEDDYNNFKDIPQRSPQLTDGHPNAHQFVTNEGQSPNKLLITTPGGKPGLKNTRFVEESKNLHDIETLTPKRGSHSRRKGKLKHSASAAFAQEVGLVLRKIQSSHPQQASPPQEQNKQQQLVIEEEPLRISKAGAAPGRQSSNKKGGLRSQRSMRRESTPEENRPEAPYKFSKYRRNSVGARSLSIGYDYEEEEEYGGEEEEEVGISNLEAKMQGITRAQGNVNNIFLRDQRQEIKKTHEKRPSRKIA